MPEMSARQAFETAYPDEPERAHAERWLGLLAIQQASDGKPLTWLHSAEMVRRPAFLLRESACAALIAAMFIPGFAIVLMSSEAHLVLSGLTLITMWGCWSASVRMRDEHGAFARDAWTTTDSYRLARSACLRRGLAWAPAGVVVGLVTTATGTGMWYLVGMTGYCFGIAALAAARTGAYPLALAGEIILASGWGERPRFAALLEGAADRGVLRADGNGYEFVDGQRGYLAGRGKAELAEHFATITARLASPLARHLALSRRAWMRAGVDAAAGSAIAAILVGASILSFYGNLSHYGWVLVFPAAAVALVIGGTTYLGLRAAAALARLALAYIPGWTPAIGFPLAAVIVGCCVDLVIGEGPALAALLAYCLPAGLVAACGAWVCVLARERTRDATPGSLRLIPDVIAVATICGWLLVLVRPALLSADPAAGLLFPVAVWGAIRIWRAMRRSRLLAVSAAANIVASLLFGGELVLLVVWLANVLGFSAPVVAALRWYLEQIGSRADLPWWVWTGLYAVLAAVGVTVVLRPGLLKRASARHAWQRILPTADVAQQALAALHVGLLAIVLIGLTVPPTAGPVLRRHLSAAYLVALQREFNDAAELSAYQAISREFTAAGPTHRTLTSLIIKVHDVAGSGGNPIEQDIALRLGELQARALSLSPTPSVDAAEQRAAAGGGGGNLTEQAGTLTKLDKANEAADARVEQSAELATKLVASTLFIPSVSDSEVFQVIREYLHGLIEGSRLTDVFAAWARHLPGAKRPAPADALLTPDPAKLEAVADTTISQVMVAQGLGDPATDPNSPNVAYQLAQQEQPLGAAVDLANQIRYLQAPSSGPCDSCAAPGIPVSIVENIAIWIGDTARAPSEERPFEEPEEPVIHEP